MVNGKKITIIWHVDDLNISHMYEKEVTQITKWMKSVYGKYIWVSRVNKHDYLGMDLDLSVQGEGRVTMVDCLNK